MASPIYSLTFSEVVVLLKIDPQKLKEQNDKTKKLLLHYLLYLKNKYQDTDFFRYNSYMTVINRIEKNNYPLSPEILRTHKIAGKKITDKLIEILETGSLREVQDEIAPIVITKTKKIHELNFLLEELEDYSGTIPQIKSSEDKVDIYCIIAKKVNHSKLFLARIIKKMKDVIKIDFSNYRILRIGFKNNSSLNIIFGKPETKELSDLFFALGGKEYCRVQKKPNLFLGYFALRDRFGNNAY